VVGWFDEVEDERFDVVSRGTNETSALRGTVAEIRLTNQPTNTTRTPPLHCRNVAFLVEDSLTF